MMRTMTIATAALLTALLPNGAAADTEIRIARQFSMGYLQFNVMEHEKLLEKHAAANGVKDLKVVWATFNGPDAMNNALISDSVDIVAGGVPGLLTLWNRTHGTANEVKGICALSARICKIAEEGGAPNAELSARCDDGKPRCERAKSKVAGPCG